MTYNEFENYVRNGMYETIYDDSEGRPILVIRLLNAYALFNEAIRQEREACARVCDDWPNGRDDVYSIGEAIRAMPITDDYGKPLRPQYRVIEKRGKWVLLYDQHQSGEVVRHEFRIQKLQHDIVLYPGITLTEAQKRFREKVEADNDE